MSATKEETENADNPAFEMTGVRIISYYVPNEIAGNVHLLFTTGAYIQKFDTYDGSFNANDKLIFNYTDLTKE